LLKDGSLSGRREDYYGIVIRTANRWPERDEGIRLRIATELGYAPETQTRTAAGLAGDVDGLAWNIVLSPDGLQTQPQHRGELRTCRGWVVVSPQFRQNESLAEIRYQWRKSRQLAIDFRIRQRRELEQLALSDRKHEELDFFLRLTWGGTIK